MGHSLKSDMLTIGRFALSPDVEPSARLTRSLPLPGSDVERASLLLLGHLTRDFEVPGTLYLVL